MATPPPDGPARVGEIIADKYEIVRPLGEGGMGVVYEARHTFVGRRVAIKFLRAEYAGETEMLARFQREAQSAGALESEHVVAVHDFGIAPDGTPYLVLEYLAGDDLAHLLARTGRLPVGRAVSIVLQACRGLAVAHGQGIVHRDLKPGNLFVLRREDGTDLVKVIDFGIAKLRNAAADAPSKTRTGATMGTPYYMPPEQARGQRDIDHRADIYALGVILYEALAGRKPHPGESYNEILFHILTQAPAPLASLRDGLPPALVQAIERAMAFEPADRFQHAVDLARALAPFAGRAAPPELVDTPNLLGTVRTPEASTVLTPVTAGQTPARVGGAPPDGATPPGSGRGQSLPTGGGDSLDVSTLSTKRRPALAIAAMIVGVAGAAGVAGVWRWLAHDPAPSAAAPTSAREVSGAATREAALPAAAALPQPTAPTLSAAPMPGAAPMPTPASVPPGALEAAAPARKSAPSSRARRRAGAARGPARPSADIDDQNPYND